MRLLAQLLSWLALAGIILPPCLYLADSTDLDTAKRWMLIASIVWFVTVPLWMGRAKSG